LNSLHADIELRDFAINQVFINIERQGVAYIGILNVIAIGYRY